MLHDTYLSSELHTVYKVHLQTTLGMHGHSIHYMPSIESILEFQYDSFYSVESILSI